MSLRYDATLKDIAQVNPAGLLAAFDVVTTLPVSLLNVDLSTVTTTADLVLGLGQPLQEIVHLDFQTSASATKHADILVYNSLLYRQYRVPVHSIVILLRPQAAHANLNGSVDYAPRPGRGKMAFGYEVVRLWERPVDELLAGHPGMLPLAVLGQLPAGVERTAGLIEVIHRVVERIEMDAAPEQKRRLMTATFVLTGLRVPRQTAQPIFQGVRNMRDSDTFMAILEEGSVNELRKMILRLGQKSFGVPEPGVATTVNGIADLERLEAILERLTEVGSWQELLNTP